MSDHSEARELLLFAENDQALYRAKDAFLANVHKKMRRGAYDPEQGQKLWLYYIDRAAKAYSKEFGGVWNKNFPRSARLEAAKEIEKDERKAIESGEYDKYPNPYPSASRDMKRRHQAWELWTENDRYHEPHLVEAFKDKNAAQRRLQLLRRSHPGVRYNLRHTRHTPAAQLFGSRSARHAKRRRLAGRDFWGSVKHHASKVRHHASQLSAAHRGRASSKLTEEEAHQAESLGYDASSAYRGDTGHPQATAHLKSFLEKIGQTKGTAARAKAQKLAARGASDARTDEARQKAKGFGAVREASGQRDMRRRRRRTGRDQLMLISPKGVVEYDISSHRDRARPKRSRLSAAKERLISKKIDLLRREGYPERQAVAIALHTYGAGGGGRHRKLTPSELRQSRAARRRPRPAPKRRTKKRGFRRYGKNGMRINPRKANWPR